MPEILHAWALAPAAIGTCCLAADRGRVRVPELLASILMLVAMLDAAVTHAVSNVVWATLLIGSAIALAAIRSPRRRHAESPAASADVGMIVHTTVGMVVMAALQLSMLHSGSGSGSGAGHVHGAGRGLLDGLLIAGAIAYAVFSAVLAARAHTRLDRAQDVAMGASVCLMAAGLVL